MHPKNWFAIARTPIWKKAYKSSDFVFIEQQVLENLYVLSLSTVESNKETTTKKIAENLF